MSLYASTCSDDSLSILHSELPEALKFRTDSVVLVGTPIGNEKFCKHFWATTLIQEIRAAVPLVCSWPDVVQRALCLFRTYITSKYNFFLRHSDPPRLYYSAEHSVLIHQLVHIGLARILDPLTTDDFQNIVMLMRKTMLMGKMRLMRKTMLMGKMR